MSVSAMVVASGCGGGYASQSSALAGPASDQHLNAALAGGYPIAQLAHAPPQQHGEGCASQPGAPVHVEIHREVDAMQQVYAQEKRTLEGLIQEMEQEMQQLRCQLPCHGVGECHPPDSTRTTSEEPERRQVRWCIEYPCREDSAERDAGRCICERFRLYECPGVRFALEFAPGGDAPCKVALKTEGPMAEGLVLGVEFSLEVETISEPACLFLTSSAFGDIVGRDTLTCEGPRLAHACGGSETPVVFSVTCTVEMHVRKWEAPIFQYDTEWNEPRANCSGDVESGVDVPIMTYVRFDTEDSDEDVSIES